MFVLATTAVSPVLSASPANAGAKWLSAHFRTHPLVGTIWTADFKQITRTELDDALSEATYILLGEMHPNADHHLLQAEIIGGLVEEGRRPSVAVEMVPREMQKVLDAISKDGSRDPAELGAALKWEHRGWPDWASYQPIAEIALSAELRLRAGDMPTALRRSVSRSGLSAIDADTRNRLGLDRDLPTAAAQALEREIISAHCDLLPESAVGKIVDVQRVRDAFLAAAMLDGGSEDGAVLIAGAGHGRRDWGVPYYIRHRQPGASIVSVAFVEVDGERGTPEDYIRAISGLQRPFDFIYFTPRAEVKDHCAELVKHFKHKHQRKSE